MKRRSVSEWQALFREQAASGLSVTAFCRERDINPNYFGLRRKQLSAPATAPATSPAFVPVALPASSATCVTIRWGEGLHVQVPVSVSPAWLADLLARLSD